MKKVLFLAILMVFCVNKVFAQNNGEFSDSTIVSSAGSNKAETSIPQAESYTKEDMVALWKTFQQYATDAQKSEQPSLEWVPVSGKSKFSRCHYIHQRLEISVIGGSDIDGEDSEGVQSVYKTQDDEDDAKRDGANFNYGLNVGYSLIFVPGKINGDMLKLNKLGFGYSFGLVASFDQQDYYGTTCDFLGKIGIEAGNGHKMGIGVDFLLGSGKTAGEYVYPSSNANDDSDINIPYTSWCLKYGAQLWVRSNLLKASIKNTDVRMFARYVYSRNPENERLLRNGGLLCNWFEESWSFGLTFCYEF